MMICLVFVGNVQAGEFYCDKITGATFLNSQGSWFYERNAGQFHALGVSEILDSDRSRVRIEASNIPNLITAANVVNHLNDTIPWDLLPTILSYLTSIYPLRIRLPDPKNRLMTMGDGLDVTRMRLHRRCNNAEYYCGIRIFEKYVVAKWLLIGHKWQIRDDIGWAYPGFVRSKILSMKRNELQN